MKYVYLAIIAVLVGIVLYLFLHDSDRELPTADQSKLTDLKTKIYKAETSRQIVIIKAKEDSVKHAEIIITHEKEIARLNRLAKKAKTTKVDTILIDNPEAGNYVQYLDSIVVGQDAEITELKTQSREQWLSFNNLIHASDSVSDAHKSLNVELQNNLDLAFKQNKKLKRQNLGLKIGVVAIPVVIVALVVLK